MAGGAVVGFVGSVADTLNFGAAARARKFVAAVDGHAFAEGGDVFRKVASGFGAEAIGPSRETVTDGFIEADDLGIRQLLGEG